MSANILKKPSRPRSTATHEAILSAAATLLANEGYTRLTIEGIARLSGAGKPTIYKWWPNKTAILIELFDRETAALLALEDVEDMKSIESEVAAWFTILWRAWQTTVSGAAFRSILAEVQFDPKALHFFSKAYIPSRRGHLLAILHRAQYRGELQGRDLDVIVDYCCGFNWYHLLTHSTPTAENIREIARTVAGTNISSQHKLRSQ